MSARRIGRAMSTPRRAALLAVLFGPAVARADGGPFGLGMLIGSPVGISAKLSLTPLHALDVAIGA